MLILLVFPVYYYSFARLSQISHGGTSYSKPGVNEHKEVLK